MATTRETLQVYFTNVTRVDAAHTIPADQNYLDSLATRVNLGIDTLAVAQRGITSLAYKTTSVANLSYNFFTGATPTSGGLDYLVSPSGDNPNNLNSAYYQNFNLENRYINFAVNLGKLGEGAARFTAEYGSLTFEQAVVKAYKEIFGIDKAGIEGILTADVGGQTRAQYFASYGKDGLTGIGTKAAMVGWLLAEAVKTPDTGTYNRAENAFLADLVVDGQAAFHTNIVAFYAQRPVYTIKDTSTGGAFSGGVAGEDGFDIHLQNFTGAPTTTTVEYPASYVLDGGFIGAIVQEPMTGGRNPTINLYVDSNSTAGLIYGFSRSGISAYYEGPVPNLKIIGPGSLKAQIAGNFYNVDATGAGDLDLVYIENESPGAGGAGTFTLGNGTNKLTIVGGYSAEKFVLGAGVDTITMGGMGTNNNNQTALNNLVFNGSAVSSPFEIRGFAKGVDHLVLDRVIHAMAADAQASVSGAASLTLALVQLSANVAVGQGAVFTYQGDTYVYAQDAVVGLNTGDGLIKLVGVTGLAVGTGAASVDIHYG